VLIGVLGDSHHQEKLIDKCIRKLNKVNIIIHTGDMISDAQYITRKYNIPVIGVAGNCDDYGAGNEEIIYNINSHKILVCHGHNYGVKHSLENLYNRGKEAGVSLVIFGHTHVPYYENRNNIHILNPGSIAFPRGFSCRCCAVVEIDEIITIKHVEL